MWINKFAKNHINVYVKRRFDAGSQCTTETIHRGVLLSISQSSLMSLKLNLNVTYLLPANHSMTCTAIKPFDTLRFDKGWQSDKSGWHSLLPSVTHTRTHTLKEIQRGRFALPTSFQRPSIHYYYPVCTFMYSLQMSLSRDNTEQTEREMIAI